MSTMTLPRVESIPAELRDRSQWALWRLEEREGRQTKIPYCAGGEGRASTTDPSTWASFRDALAGVGAHGADGIGFVFSKDDDFVGVDLDNLDSDAGAILAKLDS